MQSLTPTPTRDVTLEEALTCFCGCVLPDHDQVLRSFGENDIRPVLHCRRCETLCLDPEVRRQLPTPARKVKQWDRERYYARRRSGWCSYCAHASHDRCPGKVERVPRYRCLCTICAREDR